VNLLISSSTELDCIVCSNTNIPTLLYTFSLLHLRLYNTIILLRVSYIVCCSIVTFNSHFRFFRQFTLSNRARCFIANVKANFIDEYTVSRVKRMNSFPLPYQGRNIHPQHIPGSSSFRNRYGRAVFGSTGSMQVIDSRFPNYELCGG
jgi:hypothetical protein